MNKADCIKLIHVLHFINSMADLSEKGMGRMIYTFCSFSESYDIHVLLILLVENLFRETIKSISIYCMTFCCIFYLGVQLFLCVFECVFVLWDGDIYVSMVLLNHNAEMYDLVLVGLVISLSITLVYNKHTSLII